MPPKSKKAPVVDSWDDLSTSESESEAPPAPPAPAKTSRSLSPDKEADLSSHLSSTRISTSPPPTSRSRASESGRLSPPPRQTYRPPAARHPTAAGEDGERRRPEKTDAVARRMIAGALGVRVKTTAEQREFDKALREKEKKRKEEERRRAKEEAEREDKVKTAVWDD